VNPDEIRYTESHEWARLEGDKVVIGITEYAAKEVGDIVFVEFEENEEIAKGEPFGILETVKAVFDLYAPVSGDIAETNSEVEENPDIIKEDPLNKGWLVKVAYSDEEEFDDLMTADAYDEFCREQD
jgi:glycine cleavage system H protein